MKATMFQQTMQSCLRPRVSQEVLAKHPKIKEGPKPAPKSSTMSWEHSKGQATRVGRRAAAPLRLVPIRPCANRHSRGLRRHRGDSRIASANPPWRPLRPPPAPTAEPSHRNHQAPTLACRAPMRALLGDICEETWDAAHGRPKQRWLRHFVFLFWPAVAVSMCMMCGHEQTEAQLCMNQGTGARS